MTRKQCELWEELNEWHAVLTMAEDFKRGAVDRTHGLCWAMSSRLSCSQSARNRLEDYRPIQYDTAWFYPPGDWTSRVGLVKRIIQKVEKELEAL